MSTSAISSSSISSQALVVENAISRADGNSFDLIIELRDQNGSVIDCSAYQPSEDFLRQEIVPLVRACYCAYENSLAAHERTNPEELFTNAALVREREYCQIHQGNRVIDGAPLGLLPNDISRIKRTYRNFQGTNVRDAMDHLLSLLSSRSVEWFSQQGARMSSERPSPREAVASFSHPLQRREGNVLPIPQDSSGRAVPDIHRLMHVFPGASFGSPETADPNQRRARAHCRAFLTKTFQVEGASWTIMDVLIPTNENRQKIAALLGSCLNKIQGNQLFNADEMQLWLMLQEYFYCRNQNLIHPWNEVLKAERLSHQQSLTTHQHNWTLEAQFKFQLSCEFQYRIVQRCGINIPINPQSPDDRILQRLWLFSPN